MESRSNPMTNQIANYTESCSFNNSLHLSTDIAEVISCPRNGDACVQRLTCHIEQSLRLLIDAANRNSRR